MVIILSGFFLSGSILEKALECQQKINHGLPGIYFLTILPKIIQFRLFTPIFLMTLDEVIAFSFDSSTFSIIL